MPKEKPPQVRVVFDGEMRSRFESVKKYYGLEKNADLIRLLVTQKVEELKKQGAIPDLKVPLPRFTHFNINGNGVRIQDRALATKTCPNGMIIDVYFKPQGIFCEYDQTFRCDHIDFALTVPHIREQIMDLNKKNGWKIELPDET